MISKRIYLLSAFILFLFYSYAQTQASKIKSSFEAKEYQLTIDEINSIHASELPVDSMLYLKAYSQLKLNQLKEASITIKQILQINPTFYEANLLKGMIYAKKQKYADAIDCFNKVIDANSKHDKAFYNRALALGLLDDYKNALKDLDQCIALNPNYTLAYYNRAYWNEVTENYNAAIDDYKKTIDLDKNFNDAYFALAYMYSKVGDNTKACETLQTAKQQGVMAADELMHNYCK